MGSACLNKQEVGGMDYSKAKQILMLYRPGTADEHDPDMAEALALLKHDPELVRWFAEHAALQEALRAKFRQLPLPFWHQAGVAPRTPIIIASQFYGVRS
jgi:hypothetical protein